MPLMMALLVSHSKVRFTVQVATMQVATVRVATVRIAIVRVATKVFNGDGQTSCP